MFRLVGRVEDLSRIVNAVLFALQRCVWVCMLMAMLLYIFGVLATNFFGKNDKLMTEVEGARSWFGTVPRSICSLMQVVTMDSWSSQIARPLGEVEPLAWAFLIPFLALIGLGFLNVLSAIFVESLLEMNKAGAREEQARIQHQVL